MILEQFKGIIEFLQEHENKCNQIADISKTICADFPPFDLFGATMGHTEKIVEILQIVFKDKGDWIGYWIYELEYGSRWKEDSITEADGTSIRLQTIEDLYKFLMEEMNSDTNNE